MKFEHVVYPAFIKWDGEYGVHFPTLLPEFGWEFPLSSGRTKQEALKNAKKDLAFVLAGALYDNEDLPSNTPIPAELVTEDMELVFVKTSYSNYANEIEEHMPGRHWHIDFNRDTSSDFKAVAYKNDQGLWDLKEDGLVLDLALDKILQLCPTYPVICTVRRRAEAEAAFDRFVRKITEL